MWFPLLNYTHYSLQRGYSKPKEMVKKCVDNGYKACGICDYKTLSGTVAFYQACVEAGIKPIIGVSFGNYFLFAKNKKGWFDLIKIVSTVNNNGNEDRITVKSIMSDGNLIHLSEETETLDYVPAPSYYTNREDAKLHRIMLASRMKTTGPKIQKLLQKNERFENEDFFRCDDFFLRGVDESEELTEDYRRNIEANLDSIYKVCEEYNILSKPMLPTFPTPNRQSEKEYLKELCRDGWRNILHKQGKVTDQDDKDKYHKRFMYEFDIIENANLFGYFLIVQDIIRYVESQGWMAGPGRGSAAGCLISYMLGITKIDPIQYDLLFSRFYNAGRNTEEHISLPDIDMDVPSDKRDEVIEYINKRYGHDRVSQMITFGRLQGRSALKEVLRINDVCGYVLMNEITSKFPHEADISDQLQEMDEEERSVIMWTLINDPEGLRDYCYLTKEGKLEGDYAEYFQQAIDLEGTFKTQGKHAAGVVISKEPLNKVCPMINQKSSDEKIAGLEMSDLENLGHVKLDVLGLSLLDKLMKIKELIA